VDTRRLYALDVSMCVFCDAGMQSPGVGKHMMMMEEEKEEKAQVTCLEFAGFGFALLFVHN
jgi:hypothetical protein